jgi:hypothetical protein
MTPLPFIGDIGTTPAHRKTRIYLRNKRNKADIREFGWLEFKKDGSLHFGFTDKAFRAGLMGDAVLTKDGHLHTLTQISSAGFPDNAIDNPHVSLHASGVCHVRSEGEKPVLEFNIGQWLPVEKPFLWLVIYTDPFYHLSPKHQRKGTQRNAFFLDVVDINQSLLFHVDIIPRNWRFPAQRKDVIGQSGSGRYVVRIRMGHHKAVERAIFIQSFRQANTQ